MDGNKLAWSWRAALFDVGQARVFSLRADSKCCRGGGGQETVFCTSLKADTLGLV